MLVNEYKDNIAKDIFRNMNPIKCVEDECLRIDHVGVLIIKITMEPIEGTMDMGVMFALRVWPLSHFFHGECTFAHYCLLSAHKLCV